MAQEVSANGFTTQTGAFASVAMNRLHKSISDKAIALEMTQSKSISVNSAKAADCWDLDPDTGSVTIRNTSDKPIYISVSAYGKPSYDTILPAEAQNLLISTSYKDMSGNATDPESLAQGTDFYAEITIANPSQTEDYRDLALTMTIPSGWEIFNERMYGGEADPSAPAFSYNDIRDDRTSYYFDLPKGSRKTFRTRLTAVYEGTYILPSIRCEAMYSNGTYAHTASGYTSVTH